MHALDETIAAIATAPGAAGLAVVRVSGTAALAVSGAVFRGATPLAAADGHTLHHGWAVWPEREHERIDEVVAAVFRAPRSYTREDVVEFSCHGGAHIARCLLEALITAGARLARPGEFTLRAFLSGRLDLAQAEAVADLIHAETAAARELALGQLAGALSRRLGEIEESVVSLAAEVEARVDFAEDVGGVEVPPSVVAGIESADAALAALLERSDYARAVREGVRVPLIGRPNVGKSSLFNALVGEERAIVTPIPGTTRDRVSEQVEIAGIPVTLSDTAGLRDSADTVESLGIERTRAAMTESPLVLWVVDRSAALTELDRALARELAGRRILIALNKSDRPALASRAMIETWLDGAPLRIAEVSALTGAGLDTLRAGLAALLGGGAARAEGALTAGALAASNARHVEALSRARAALGRAREVAGRAPGEIVALELREALAGIAEVTGRTAGEELLDRIFERFCIGK